MFDIVNSLMPYLRSLLFFGGGLFLLASMERLHTYRRSPVHVERKRLWLLRFGIALAITSLGAWMKYEAEFHDGMYCPSASARRPDGWKVIDLRSFQIGLPADWQYQPQRGIDSFAGALTNGDMQLSFDHGWFSNDLKNWSQPEFDRYCLRIDGYRAVIVNEVGVQTGRVGIHFPNLGGFADAIEKLTIAGDGTPTQRETAILAFQQIRFD